MDERKIKNILEFLEKLETLELGVNSIEVDLQKIAEDEECARYAGGHFMFGLMHQYADIVSALSKTRSSMYYLLSTLSEATATGEIEIEVDEEEEPDGQIEFKPVEKEEQKEEKPKDDNVNPVLVDFLKKIGFDIDGDKFTFDEKKLISKEEKIEENVKEEKPKKDQIKNPMLANAMEYFSEQYDDHQKQRKEDKDNGSSE